MLIAWSDHEALGFHIFVINPLINAIAPFWCLIMHHGGENQDFLDYFSPFTPF
jgi:hypothetical protein